jgi:hypothetical protein
MELQLLHIAGFDREDCGALELHIMIVVELIFTFHQFVGLPKPDMPVLLLHSGLNGTTPLPTVDMTAVMEDDAVHTQMQPELFLGGRRVHLMCLANIMLVWLRVDRATGGPVFRFSLLPNGYSIAPCIIFPPSSVPSFPITWWLFHIALFTCHNGHQ